MTERASVILHKAADLVEKWGLAKNWYTTDHGPALDVLGAVKEASGVRAESAECKAPECFHEALKYLKAILGVRKTWQVVSWNDRRDTSPQRAVQALRNAGNAARRAELRAMH